MPETPTIKQKLKKHARTIIEISVFAGLAIGAVLVVAAVKSRPALLDIDVVEPKENKEFFDILERGDYFLPGPNGKYWTIKNAISKD